MADLEGLDSEPRGPGWSGLWGGVLGTSLALVWRSSIHSKRTLEESDELAGRVAVTLRMALR